MMGMAIWPNRCEYGCAGYLLESREMEQASGG